MSTTDSTGLTAPLSIPRLRADFKGRVIAPGDDDYDEAPNMVGGQVVRGSPRVASCRFNSRRYSSIRSSRPSQSWRYCSR